MYQVMAQIYGWLLTLFWLICDLSSGVPLGYIDNYSEFKTRHGAYGRKPESRKHHVPQNYGSIHPSTKMYYSSHKNTKKSDMPEKGQIKFMKTLLGKVKTLLHSDDSKKEKIVEKKVEPLKIPDKISTVASDNGKLYGMLNDDKNDEKSVNVISIPVDALKTISKSVSSENELKMKGADDLEHTTKGTKIALRPVLVQLASNRGENKGVTSFVPVVLSNQVPRLQPLRAYSNPLPDEQNKAPFGTPQVPLIIERHREIAHHSKGDEGLYRDIGHIPGELTFKHDPSEEHNAEDASLRHRSPARYHYHPREEDDDDYDGDDVDDDDEDDVDDQYDYRNSPQMRAEERRIATTRKRLYDMLPGNDPTYTSESRGLGWPMNPSGTMQMPEAFLGNPMVQPGAGNLRNLMPPSIGTALAGEHADNSNDRSVFMFGGQSPTQVYGDSDVESDEPGRQSPSMKLDSEGFDLGGREAEAMSPNEASYQLQKQPGIGQLSERGHISRPRNKGVLLKVNGRPIGDSRELRSRVVNGKLLKGKEKIIKSKGAMDVKVSKATDGVHSKVVDITSTGKVKVLEAKSKIAKTDGK